MKRRILQIICLIVVGMMLFGCKSNTPPTNLGPFSVKIPGTIEKSNEQLPIADMGLDISTPLVMTTAQSMPNSQELYLTICVEWEQMLNALSQKTGTQIDQQAFTDSVEQNVVNLLTIGATVGQSQNAQYGKLTGEVLDFSIVQGTDNDLSIWANTKGQLVTFASQKRLIVLVYAADASAYSEKHKETFFSSIVITQ